MTTIATEHDLHTLIDADPHCMIVRGALHDLLIEEGREAEAAVWAWLNGTGRVPVEPNGYGPWWNWGSYKWKGYEHAHIGDLTRGLPSKFPTASAALLAVVAYVTATGRELPGAG